MDAKTSPPPDVSEADPTGFAFARIRGVVHLVYAPNLPIAASSAFALPSSPLKPSTSSPSLADTPVPVFRHDFVSVFRFSHVARAGDLRLLERLPQDAARHEPHSDTVFLSREAAVRMRALDSANSPMRIGGGATVGGCPPAYRAVPRRAAPTRRVF
jgi:hypothetical protein